MKSEIMFAVSFAVSFVVAFAVTYISIQNQLKEFNKKIDALEWRVLELQLHTGCGEYRNYSLTPASIR